MKMLKIWVAAALPALLSGCFLVPGVFTSSLDLRKSGEFTYAYKGEILFQSPEDAMPGRKSAAKPWTAAMAVCPREGDPYIEEDSAASPAPAAAGGDEGEAAEPANRQCSRAEIAKLRQEYEERQRSRAEKEKKEGEQFAAMFGFNPADEASNQKLAAALLRYDGWKSAVYKGNGVFEVDYQLTGKIGHDFIFPVFPQGDYLIPFVIARGQDKGAVRVRAPALIGGGMKAMYAQARMMGAPADKDAPGSPRTRGTFTLITDGEILTNNTDDGPAAVPGGRRLSWSIDPSSEKIPEALVRLK